MEAYNKSRFLLIAALPFYLNDFSNMYVKEELLWLTIDYCLKLLPLLYLFLLLRKGTLSKADLGLVPLSPKQFISWTSGMTALGLCLDEPGFALWSKLLPAFRLGSIPIGTDSSLYMLDMTVGLALVAAAEEIIFRGLAFSAFKERGYPEIRLFIVSAIIFGLIHWSQGPAAIVATAVTGSGLMLCMWRTGSVYPSIIAHFVINYLSFSGLAAEFWGL